MTPFQALHGRVSPLLLSYNQGSTTNSIVDQSLKERDRILGVLKENLRVAQDKMKKKAYQKRREVELLVGDLVFLKIRPFKQKEE